MTDIIIYGVVKEILIITFFVQVALGKIKFSNQNSNQVFLLYVIAILLNDFIVIFWNNASVSFNIFHVIGPLAIIFGIYFSRLKESLTIVIATLIGIAILILWIDSFTAYIFLYVMAISFLIKRSISMVRREKLNIYKSSLYIILALDLFASFLELSLGNTPFDWSESLYINYLWHGLISMYLFTLISLNVFFRRLFTT